jgi:hypothetical protein
MNGASEKTCRNKSLNWHAWLYLDETCEICCIPKPPLRPDQVLLNLFAWFVLKSRGSRPLNWVMHIITYYSHCKFFFARCRYFEFCFTIMRKPRLFGAGERLDKERVGAFPIEFSNFQQMKHIWILSAMKAERMWLE